MNPGAPVYQLWHPEPAGDPGPELWECCAEPDTGPVLGSGRWVNRGCSRRGWLGWGLGLGLAAGVPLKAAAQAAPPSAPRLPLADVHSHMGLFGPSRTSDFNPAQFMARGAVRLVAWKWVPDLRLIQRGPDGRLLPPPAFTADELWANTEPTLQRMRQGAEQAGLGIVTSAADVQAARAGKASVVLASEGCDFADEALTRVDTLHAMGVRHLQLVHYVPNPFSDIQSRPEQHGGLTERGAALIARCEARGMLVDFAHMTPRAVMMGLERATRPVIWSHSALRAGPNTASRIDRLLPVDAARAIAAKGGVVGLWGLNETAGMSLRGYARLVRDTLDLLGEDHVAFGTDLSGLGRMAVIEHYGDLADVMDRLVDAGLSETVLRKLAFDNYARVLQAALAT